MKNIFLIVTLFISISFFAQNTPKGAKKIRTLKIAFLTEELDLTENEAQKFWPVYNTYQKKISLLRVNNVLKLRKQLKEKGGLKALSNTEAKEIVEKSMVLEKEICKETNAFQKRLITILPYKKIILLKIAEKEFQRNLLRKLKNRRLKQNR